VPIYEYTCRACERTFSALVTSSRTPDEETECPECKEHQADKQLSMRTSFMGVGGTKQTPCGRSVGAGSGFT